MDNRDTPNWKGRPSLVLSHPNARGTGSTLWMTLVPATGDHCGFIRVRIAPQSKKQGYAWDSALESTLSETDLAKLLMVFTGWTERTANEGSGMDNTIRHTPDNGSVVTVDLSHRVDPYPSYCLSLVRRGPGKGTEQVQIELSNAEALAITEAIRGAMPYVAFGVPRLAKEEE